MTPCHAPQAVHAKAMVKLPRSTGMAMDRAYLLGASSPMQRRHVIRATPQLGDSAGGELWYYRMTGRCLVWHWMRLYLVVRYEPAASR